MSEVPKGFWYPKKDGRDWQEKLPTAYVARRVMLTEVAQVQPVEKPQILDQFGRPIEPETVDERSTNSSNDE